MYSKPCLTHVDTASRLISEQEAILYWIFIRVTTLGTEGLLRIFDGWDAAGVEKCRLVVAYNRLYSFYPPFICNDALYIAMDQNITSYSLGYLPAKLVFPERYKVKQHE